MKTKQKNTGVRKALVALIYYVSVIPAALVLGIIQQIDVRFA